MSDQFNIYLAQLNPTVGAIEANCHKISEAYRAGLECGADLVVTPELSMTGYPPEDLLDKPFFQRVVLEYLNQLKGLTEGEYKPGLLVGLPWSDGRFLYNSLALLADGSLLHLRHKCELPNYGVFDEKRHFQAGFTPMPMAFRRVRLGGMICEDMWFPRVSKILADEGADILIVPTCSPYERNKVDKRMMHAAARAADNDLPLIFLNQIGGQDELVFDGNSFILDQSGVIVSTLAAWKEEGRLISFKRDEGKWSPVSDSVEDVEVEDDWRLNVYQAMVLSLRDYVEKNKFPGVIIGLSGGVDSALTAAVAVDALGADRVSCVMMPSRYTSDESLEDAAACADLLGVKYRSIPITPGVSAFDEMLGDAFEGLAPDTSEENIQSRLRAVILMALSNKFGSMLVTTGNKSEMSVGYATLYGDMCGGYSVLKDVYKTDVFELCQWRNEIRPANCLGPEGPVMPMRVITKPPTAELREDQKDEDSLPPYDRLDAILKGLVDREESVSQLVEQGFQRAEVARIEHLLYIAEYKRRQAPPGVKITARNFGRDRRYPITNGFRSARSDVLSRK